MEDDKEILLPRGDELYANCEELDVDGVFEKTVPFGRFQILLQILVFCILALTTYQGDLLYFIGYNPPWTCVQKNSSEFCKENYGIIIETFDLNFTKRCHLSRYEWKYVSKRISFITEFDLICDKNSMGSLTGAIFSAGAAVGAVIGSTIADLIGRKPVWSVSILLAAVISITASYIASIWQLIILRFLSGIQFSIIGDTTFVMIMEYVPTRLRPIPTNVCAFAILTSNLLMDLVAYYVNDWRLILRYGLLPSLLFLLFIVLVPESPRWLLSVGKVEKSKVILERIANVNKKALHNIQLKSNSTESNAYTYIDLWRAPQARKLLIINGIMSLTIGLLLYCSVLQMSNLGENIYGSYAILVVASVPAYFICVPLCSRFGRKKSTLIPYLLSGVMLGIIALLLFLEVNIRYPYVVLNVATKFLGTVAMSSYTLWVFELFPTVVRMRGLAFGGFMYQIGSIASPFFTNTLQTVNVCLPFLIMFLMTLFAVFSGFFLNETKDQPSRETLDDLLGPRVPTGVEIYDAESE